MLTAIRIGNFKAFAEAQRIPVRPLTLIYGANSSGKSSILHSLILAHHVQNTGNLDVHRTALGGESVDLGGFRQFIHRCDLSRRMEWSAEIDTLSFTGRMAELVAPINKLTASITIGVALDDQGRWVRGSSPEILSYEVLGDDRSLIRMSKRGDGMLKLDRLDQEHPVLRAVLKAIVESATTTETLQASDYVGLDEAISEVVPAIVIPTGRFLPEGLAWSELLNPGAQTSLFPISRGRRREDLAAAIRFFIPRTLDELIRGISQILASELNQLRYLGPLRSYPPRHLAFCEQQDSNWLAGGGFAWELLKTDEVIRGRVNDWLGHEGRLQTKYRLDVVRLSAVERILQSIDGALEGEYGDRFDKTFYSTVYVDGQPTDEEDEVIQVSLVVPTEISKLLERHIEEEVLQDAVGEVIIVDKQYGTRVSHRDVGIGISQVIPVLVSAYANRDALVAIEQPEIHLHPALQADLGDVFIQSAFGEAKNRFLIETHSEHMLLRIMRRIRETSAGRLPEGIPAVHPDQVMVLFVEPVGSRGIIHEMPINEKGDLVKPWPGGFFEEDFKELF
jgi:hypothetical protein